MMNQELVQDVVAEVMRRLGPRSNGASSQVRAGEDAPANDAKFKEAEQHPHRISSPTGKFGIFDKVDDCVAAATDSQKKLAKLSLDDRDAIVKLVKKMAKDNAQAWGKMEFDE